jgi:Neuraminidase (sialidase)
MPGLHYPGTPPVGGGGSEEIFNLTSAPDGGWTLLPHARATYYNGYTYFTWTRGDSTGPIYVASYNHTTEVVSTPVLIDGMNGVDTHNSPAMLVRDSDHKLLLAFCIQGSANIFTRLSTTSLDTDPDLGDGLAAAVNIDSSIGGSDYTYPMLVQLTGVASDPIYLFYRDEVSNTGRIAYSKSTDNGATWSARTVVMSGAASFVPYFIVRSSTTRIDVASTDRAYSGSEGSVDLGHMYMNGSDDKWYTSAGVEITATKPFGHSELTQLESNVGGAFASDGIAGTNPVFAYHVASGSTVTAKYVRWDGAAWDSGTIYTADSHPVDGMFGGLAINRAATGEVFSGIETGTSSSELYTYVSADLGLTWDAGTAITTGSADFNAAVTPIENGVSTLPVIWLRGTLTSSYAFTMSIKGLRR